MYENYENVEACYKIVQEFSLFIYRSKIEYSFDGTTIVYCPTKKATETVVSELRGNLFVLTKKMIGYKDFCMINV